MSCWKHDRGDRWLNSSDGVSDCSELSLNTEHNAIIDGEKRWWGEGREIGRQRKREMQLFAEKGEKP